MLYVVIICACAAAAASASTGPGASPTSNVRPNIFHSTNGSLLITAANGSAVYLNHVDVLGLVEQLDKRVKLLESAMGITTAPPSAAPTTSNPTAPPTPAPSPAPTTSNPTAPPTPAPSRPPTYAPRLTTADTSTLRVSSSRGWAGPAAVVANRYVYAAPFSGTKVLIVDTAGPSIDTSSISVQTGTAKWYGAIHVAESAAASSNLGAVYFVPMRANSVLIVDPATKSADTTSLSGLSGGWRGGIQSSLTGELFFVPETVSSILIVNPLTHATTSKTLSTSTSRRFSGAAEGKNGDIFFVPFQEPQIIVLNPLTRAVTSIPLTFGSGAGSLPFSGAIAVDGGKRVLTVPSDANYFLDIDTTTRTVKTVSFPFTSAGKYENGVVGPDGLVYMFPLYEDDLLAMSPSNLADRSPSLPFANIAPEDSKGHWTGGAVVGNRIYGIPYDANNVLILK